MEPERSHRRELRRRHRVEAVLTSPENAAAAERVLAALGLDVEEDDRPRRISLPLPEGADELSETLAALR